MKNGSKRRAWTSVQVRELKTMGSLPPRLQFLMTVPALPATIIKVINGRRVSVQQQQAGSAVFMWIDCAMAPAESLTPGGIPMPPTTSTVPPFETVTPLTAPPDELSLV